MGYHQLEDIALSELKEEGEARLTPAETTRTLIEVNNSATLVFSGVASNETHQNVFCQDLPYLTDEHGSKTRLSCQHQIPFDVCFRDLTSCQAFTFK